GERKILYYRNPMGLPDTSPVPKKDSMGMDYIPVYADDAPDDAGVVKVSPARVQTLGVRTAQAELRVLDAPVRAVGRVEIDERRIHDVSPRFEGWIEKLHVDATGDPVRRGQPLFTVYSPELVSAQKELAIAESLRLDTPGADPAARESARRLAEAARARLKNWSVTPGVDIAANPERVVFRAPASGIVLDKAAVEGMRFAPGMAIYRIADLSSVWVIADVYEQDIARVTTGQPAMVSIDAFPGRHFEAKVSYLYPTLNAATRTTPVRLELANPDGLLRPGMFAHVELATAGAKPRLTVPTSAIVAGADRQVVLVAEGEGRFRPQAVELGLRGRDHVEVLSGLDAGARVVVSANFLIDAESNLKAALANFGAGDEPAGAPRYATNGAFEDFFADTGTVMLAHEAIPDLQWPAMSMEFGLADPALIEGLESGTPIRFEFEDRGNGEFVVVAIEPADAAADHGARESLR
ncbi:MAG TPA: efflux RND transporter periplasmic adaptor subunit, partial [Rhodocyclaceae bacterium]|nr:efflux RND transporter periplasmic adaptor subunit [Rhodocyclaceae bacterium]